MSIVFGDFYISGFLLSGVEKYSVRLKRADHYASRTMGPLNVRSLQVDLMGYSFKLSPRHNASRTR